MAILVIALLKIVEGSVAVLLGVAALVVMFTSLTGVCPCYMRLNLNTIKKNNEILGDEK